MSFGFKQQSVGETTYLIYEIDDNLEIDSFAIHMMANNQFTNIVQTQIVSINEKRQIQFNITGLMKLDGRISLPRPKREVLGILNSILNAFEEVDAYMLDMEHLFLEWEYIYLDGQGNCMLIYLPFDHNFSKDKIDFLQEVVSRIQPDYQEKDPYLFDILNAFSRGAIQKLSDFREIIKKSASVPKAESGEKKAEVLAQTPEIPVKPQEKEEAVIPKAAEKKAGKKTAEKKLVEKRPGASPKIPVINIPGREPGTKEVPQIPRPKPVKTVGKKNLFAIPKKNKKTDNQIKERESDRLPARPDPQPVPGYGKSEPKDMYESYEHTVIMQEPPVIQGREEGTVILEQPESAIQPPARLIRRQDGTEYRINKGKVVVGSGTAADIRINNNAVSRSHATIVCEQGDYYIEDTQSRNGSFLGGRRIQPGVKEPLYDGMLLKLANEDFEFIKG